MSNRAWTVVRPVTGALALVSCALLLAAAAADVPAQPANSKPSSGAALSDFAKSLISHYELVAAGTFVFDYGSIPKDFYKQRPRSVVAEFRVTRGYKGTRPDDVVLITLSSDMLAVPGESISAGAKRDQLWADLDRRRAQNNEALSALDQAQRAGQLTQTEYATRHAKLKQEGSRISQESGELSTVAGVRRGIDRRTFFELGGVVTPRDEYLIAVNRAENADNSAAAAGVVYALPFMTTGIFWGEQRDKIVAALNANEGNR